MRQGRALWLQFITMILAAFGVLIAARAASLSRWWVAAPSLVVAVGLLGFVAPPVANTAKSRFSAFRRQLRLRSTWESFQREVEELSWVHGLRDARNMRALVSGFTQMPSTAGGTALMNGLQSEASSLASLESIFESIIAACRLSWPGESNARLLVQAFESFVAYPATSGWITRLKALDPQPQDMPQLQEWLNRYKAGIATYSRFARDHNARLGERFYREQFP